MFRFATPDDASELADLVNSVYRGDLARMGWKTESALLDGPRTSPDGILATLARPGSVILVFPSEGPIEACVNLERGPEFAYLGLLCVRADLQNHGYASEVLTHAESFILAAWQLSEVRMTVIGQREELIAYYQRRGYHLTEDRQPFPYDDPSLGTPKTNDLYFAVLRKGLTMLTCTAERLFRGAAAPIYEAWTEKFDLWFAEPGTLHMRAEVGPPWFFLNKKEWGSHPHYGRFFKLEPHSLIETAWITGPKGTGGTETVLRIQLTPQANGTLVQLTHSGFHDEKSRDAHADNWPAALEHLDTVLFTP